MNVNFYDKILSLYINGIPCARRKITVLERGMPENTWRKYAAHPVDKDGRSVLTEIFNIMYDETLFKHRPYYNPYFCVWLLNDADALFHGDRLYEDDIKDISVKIEYEPCRESVSMKKLSDYPSDLVIDYLKERGITSCPLITE